MNKHTNAFLKQSIKEFLFKKNGLKYKTGFKILHAFNTNQTALNKSFLLEIYTYYCFYLYNVNKAPRGRLV